MAFQPFWQVTLVLSSAHWDRPFSVGSGEGHGVGAQERGGGAASGSLCPPGFLGLRTVGDGGPSQCRSGASQG